MRLLKFDMHHSASRQSLACRWLHLVCTNPWTFSNNLKTCPRLFSSKTEHLKHKYTNYS